MFLLCVGMDISTCLKLKEMHRCFFEPEGPRVCHETSPGLTCASRNRRRVISYAVFHLSILSVVSFLLWGWIVTNQLENFQAISVSQIGYSQIGKPLPKSRRTGHSGSTSGSQPVAKRSLGHHHALTKSDRYSLRVQGPSHATSKGGRAGGCQGWCWVEY